MKIEISKETAEQIQILNERYYFGLFKNITTSEDEEMQIRYALQKLSKVIRETMKI